MNPEHHLLVGERKRGLANDEVLARLELETVPPPPPIEDRIAGLG
jgi:hypothetical protein